MIHWHRPKSKTQPSYPFR